MLFLRVDLSGAIPAQHLQQILYIPWQGGLKGDSFLGSGVFEGEAVRVQGAARQDGILGAGIEVLKLPGVDDSAVV